MLAQVANRIAAVLSGPRRRLVLTALGATALVSLTLLLSHQQGYVDLSHSNLAAWPAWASSPVIHGRGEPVVFSLIVRGNETAVETAVLLKVSCRFAWCKKREYHI
jgi:hypothetical protein